MKPTVSVIIPSYQHKPFIRNAIDSVLNQTFSSYELLISDDHSIDGTVKILKAYEPKIPGRVFYQETRLGPVEQIHFLCGKAQGKYIALLNSDDLWEPTKLEKQVQYMESHPEIAACFTQAGMIDGYGRPVTEKQFPLYRMMIQPNRSRAEWIRYFWENGNCLCHPSILARSEIYGKEFLLNPAYRQLPDFDMWVRLIQKKPIHIIEEQLTWHRRINGGNTSDQNGENTSRLYNELAVILYQMLTKTDDSLVLEAFSDLFPWKVDLTCSDLRPERFFLMLEAPLCQSQLRQKAIEYFIHHASDPSFLKQMESRYQFSLKKFYALSANTVEEKKVAVERILKKTEKKEVRDMKPVTVPSACQKNKDMTVIPVMHCFDNNYVIPAAVSFFSMLQNADPNYFYQLYVLHTDITIQNQQKLTKLVESFPNASLSFIGMQQRFDSLWNSMHNTDHLSKEVLYKLVAPEIFPDLDRLIITDVDVVFLGDISESYFALDGREDALFAGVRQINPDKTFLRDYYENYRKTFGEEGYNQLKVCGGYLVSNLKRQRKVGIQEVFIDYLRENGDRLLQAEQDVINMCCRESEIVLLPLQYCLCSYTYDFSEQISTFATDPFYSYTDIREAMDHPVQLHYATKVKPWNTPDCTRSFFWFDYLYQTDLQRDYEEKMYYSSQKSVGFVGSKYLDIHTPRAYPVMVSVLCCCYNHAEFIAQALDGILNQETSYSYEIIISDDGSQDGTQDVIRQYAQKYPDVVKKVTLREKNVGIGLNYYEALCQVEGKYLAICDGDDYWVDPQKLQKQVDYLEKHGDCAVVCGNFRTHRSGTPEEEDSVFRVKDFMHSKCTDYTIRDFIIHRFIASCTVMMRWRLHDHVPDFLKHYRIIDFPLELIHASTGTIHVFDEEFSVYTEHKKGVTKYAQNEMPFEKNMVLQEVNEFLHYGLTPAINDYKRFVNGITTPAASVTKPADSPATNVLPVPPVVESEIKHGKLRAAFQKKGFLHKIYHAIVPLRIRNYIFGKIFLK